MIWAIFIIIAAVIAYKWTKDGVSWTFEENRNSD
jgi:hypothetical protein